MRRLLVTLLALLVLAGCTGVPTSSAPATVEPVTPQVRTTALPPPFLNGDPRTIVQWFLVANASNTGDHNNARSYLTSAASNGWSDGGATIIANDFSIGTYNQRAHAVTVYGRVLGTLDQHGIYTPSLLAQGEGGGRQPFVFDIAKAGTAYRISNLHSGLLLTDQQFRSTYQQRVLYFYDAAKDSLVADLRWSALADRTELAEWLLTQLVDGPRPELQNAVSLDTLPAQADARQMLVRLGSPTDVEVPGSSQLDPAARDRLAAQLAETLDEPLSGGLITITDGGRPVTIRAVQGTQFNAADFSQAIGPPLPESKVYYLQAGRVHDDSGKALTGPLGGGGTSLSSVAVSRPKADGPLLVAGVAGTGSAARLEVGTQRGLQATGVRGVLSRPAFVPGRGEVWIGDGSQVYRVNVGDGTPRAHVVPIRAVSGGGQVLSVRLSPEGSRVAMVVSGAGGSAQLYIGSVVRGAGAVSIDGLVPISPQGVVVRDVAWLDSFKLFAIGYLVGSQDSRTFETGADGSEWTNQTIGNLPSPPDTVTASTASNVWVSANNYVWQQSGSSWVSPGPTGQTPGSAPVYLE
jgi:hypothetical protein